MKEKSSNEAYPLESYDEKQMNSVILNHGGRK